MGSEMRTVALGDIAEFANGLNFSSNDDGSGLRVLKVKDFGAETRFTAAGLDEIDPSNVRVAGQHMLVPGDLVLVRSNGNPDLVARTMIFLGGDAPVSFSGFCIRVRVNPELADSTYILYALRSPSIRRWLRSRGAGTSIQNVSQAALKELPVCLPSLAEQQRIARLLQVVDEKIDLNRSMSRTLAEFGETLYARLLAESRDRAGSRVSEYFEVTMGQSPPGSTYNEFGDGLPFYQGRADFGYRFPRRRVYCSAPSRLARPGDVLLSVRAPVGALNVAEEPCALGRGVASVRSAIGAASFTYYAMNALKREFQVFEGEGTVFGAINRRALQDLPMPSVDRDEIMSFECEVKPLDARLHLCQREIRTLQDVRDTLLPALFERLQGVSDA